MGIGERPPALSVYGPCTTSPMIDDRLAIKIVVEDACDLPPCLIFWMLTKKFIFTIEG